MDAERCFVFSTHSSDKPTPAELKAEQECLEFCKTIPDIALYHHPDKDCLSEFKHNHYHAVYQPTTQRWDNQENVRRLSALAKSSGYFKSQRITHREGFSPFKRRADGVAISVMAAVRMSLFPLKNKELCQLWIRNISRRNWKPNSSSSLCSRHFTANCFYSRMIDDKCRTRLYSQSVPTIFKHRPVYLQTLPKQKEQWAVLQIPVVPVPTATDNVNRPSVIPSTSNCEHSYASPSEEKRKLSESQDKCENARKKHCQQKLHVAEGNQDLLLKDILENLKKERYLTDDSFSVMETLLPGITLELFRNSAKNYQRSSVEEVKRFAMSLYFYSPKAYKFAGEKLFLPHSSTLHQWFKSFDGQPGFTEEVFQTLKVMSETEGKRYLCCLSWDEMAIRKQVIFNGKEFTGYVDYGTGIAANENLTIANEALVFMITCLEDSWKLPVAYFLIDGITSTQKAEFLNVCLQKLYDVGVDVVATVCDGLSSNLAMYHSLGVVTQPENLVCTFRHPSDENLKVCAMFDVCQMLKLLQNLLVDHKMLLNDDGSMICWEYLAKLHELQHQQLLTGGNTLDHIEWYKHKVKVKLASQTFSKSVADALEFVQKIHVPGFQDCSATIDFLTTVNTLFDICNSRNPSAEGLKGPLKSSTKDCWKPELMHAREMLLGLEVAPNKKVHATSRRTCILGIVMTIDSILYLADTLLDGRLKYLLTSKCSQDHLELFFWGIRSKGGNDKNNNPNAVQLQSAYQELIISRLVSKQKTGNCPPLEAIKMLPLAANHNSDGTLVDIATISCKRRESEIVDMDHEYAAIMPPQSLTLYVENIALYISGFISRKLLKKISCTECKSALVDVNQELRVPRQVSVLLNMENKVGLIEPSRSVYVVANMTERHLRIECNHPSPSTNLLQLQCRVLFDLQGLNIFTELDDHIYDSELDLRVDDHVTTLKKLIIREYLTLRCYQ